MNRTDTAHLHWDETWKSEQGREQWLVPENDIVDTVPILQHRQAWDVLDLGCGIGRHALFLTKQGFNVFAMDGSPSGLAFFKEQMAKENLKIDIRQAEIVDLPYDKESMDYILAWNVIYHGDLSIVHRSISEILRVLRPNGLFQGTMLSKRNFEVTQGQQISKNTYINSSLSDKSHPHFYCSASELTSLFDGFEFWWLKDQEHKTRKGSYHWHFLVEKQ